MKPLIEHDVLIVGSGPGGSSTAIRLAEFGFDVAIIERLPFPRAHVGICIADQTLALLDYLGVAAEFRGAGFWRRNLTAVRWGDGETRRVPQAGFHLDRGILDQLMLNKARAAGVTVYQPSQAREIQPAEGAGWTVTIDAGGESRSLKGQFIVDAAGRRPALRDRRVKDGPPLLALHADWSLANRPDFDGLIEAGTDAWLWYAQTATDRSVISIFLDPRRLRADAGESLQSSYTRLLQQFQVLPLARFARQCSDPRGCDASSHHSGDIASERHIRVGDACLSVDPLSSQGVHLALQSGIQAAIVIRTILQKPDNAGLALQFYKGRVDERIRTFTERTRDEYRRVSAVRSEIFWHERAGKPPITDSDRKQHRINLPPSSAPGQVMLSPSAILEKAPVIDGDFVEERQVLRHPNIEGTIAYVDGINVIELLASLPRELAYRDIPTCWQNHIPVAKGGEIASWLWNKRILEEAT